ncbi:MAG: hypothetical protein M3362_16945 [Acidobacteriota bacterium]|nr:hypothetical protein [Acidobacteriota bacterium]
MRLKLSSILITLFLLSLLACGDQTTAASGTHTSGGKLNLNYQPYAGKGHEEMPVEVLTFDVRGAEGTWVREWRLKNHSDKAVDKIRLTLFVYSKNDPDTLLLRHSTAAKIEYETILGVRLSPGEELPKGTCSPTALSCLYAFAMLSARDLLKPLFPNGEPEGDYIIALGIDKVWFADGTLWELAAAKDN